MQADHTRFGESGLAGYLKKARETKGLSQRDLSDKIDVPQSHISKIESGKVDIKTSSLIELARALDLEIMLVPRSLVPAVEALSRTKRSDTDPAIAESRNRENGTNDEIELTHRELAKIQKDATKLSRRLSLPELTRLAETARDLNTLRIPLPQIDRIRAALKSITANQDALRLALNPDSSIKEALKSLQASGGMKEAFKKLDDSSDIKALKRLDAAGALREISEATNILRNIRNGLAHGGYATNTRIRPAYRLDDGDSDG